MSGSINLPLAAFSSFYTSLTYFCCINEKQQAGAPRVCDQPRGRESAARMSFIRKQEETTVDEEQLMTHPEGLAFGGLWV